ncbi:ankyrin repeat protein [Ilyonectria destructans]|nr:ankyrin repeat protein [Ilyonectria destructans]
MQLCCSPCILQLGENQSVSCLCLCQPKAVAMAQPETGADEASIVEIRLPNHASGSKDPDAASDKSGDDDAASVKSFETATSGLFSSDTSSTPELDERSLGLNIISNGGWSGSHYDDYDIVTVHGLRDDYRTAWIDANQDWWVRDSLLKDLDVRQIDYAYDIDEGATIYGPDGIRIHAQALVTELARVRRELDETETDRPILWICHDIGGTIVKEALSMALANPLEYGKMAVLSTAIFFLSTPHRALSVDHLEDELLQLIYLPGSQKVRTGALEKAKNLAAQVHRINQEFLHTKLLDRAVIFNVFTKCYRDYMTQPTKDDKDDDNASDDSITTDSEAELDPVTPFPRFAHSYCQSFETFGRFRTVYDHMDLVKGDPNDAWISTELNNTSGCLFKVEYKFLENQAHLLSLAPPTQSTNVPYNSMLPPTPFVRWIMKQVAPNKKKKLKALRDPKIVHLHCNGDASLDLDELSRLCHNAFDDALVTSELESSRNPREAVVYFEFDRNDSRYKSIEAMMVYYINIMVWRFWDQGEQSMTAALSLQKRMKSWSRGDIFHIFCMVRHRRVAVDHQVKFFISCFDQCPEEERIWFLDRMRREQSYTDGSTRLIISTTGMDSLVAGPFPEILSINMAECPALSRHDGLADELRSDLSRLLTRRPLCKAFQSQLETFLSQCHDSPHLGRVILTWLENNGRGTPRSELEAVIGKLSPVSAQSAVQGFVDFLPPERRQRARNVFNWVKHAAEPWTAGSLAQAIAISESPEQDAKLDQLDPAGLMSWVDQVFGGIITIRHGEVRFSHSSFHSLSEIGIEGSPEEVAHQVNSQLAEICLRFFSNESAREALSAFSLDRLEGGPWESLLSATVIAYQRSSMAEYAVRFWPHHYRASGKLTPSGLVREMLASKESRGAWEVPFYTMSNPVTRINRSYISLLPVFAMLGLEELVRSECEPERRDASFETDCWYAITEAARAGNKDTVQWLLEQVKVDEAQLRDAIFWAAAYGKGGALDMLLDKVPDPATFDWPEDLLTRSIAAGLDNLLTAILRSKPDINAKTMYFDAPPIIVAAYTSQVSTMETLLKFDPKPDLSLVDSYGDTALSTACIIGDPRAVQALLGAGADVELPGNDGLDVVRATIAFSRPRALELVIESGADFKNGDEDASDSSDERAPLIIAADVGNAECVRVLLAHGADPNTECASGTALYRAVANERVDIARQLLENQPDAAIIGPPPEDEDTMLVSAVASGNTELVSLLVEFGAKLNYLDPNRDGDGKSPLMLAACDDKLEIAELLVKEGADVNYTDGNADVDSPLFVALCWRRPKLARMLLKHNADPHWTSNRGWNMLHASFDCPEIFPELLKFKLDIDSCCRSGTVLHLAAGDDEAQVVAMLLNNDPKPDLEIPYDSPDGDAHDEKYTALMMACVSPSPPCLRLLLRAGANPRYRANNNHDAASVLVGSDGHVDKIIECLEMLTTVPHKVDVTRTYAKGNTLLHMIKTKTHVSLVQLLHRAKVPLNKANEEGYTPLAVAIGKGNEEVAEYLISWGASVNVFHPAFGSLLHIACESGLLRILKLLIDAGADKEAVDPGYMDGESLLYTTFRTMLPRIRVHEKELIARYLVDEVKVPINKLGGRFGYPIIQAVARNIPPALSIRTIKFLIRRKANLEVADDQGRRAVHIAAMRVGHPHVQFSVLQTLLDAKADGRVKDRFGRRPIHFAAASSNNLEMYPVPNWTDDFDIADDDNWTPLLWAARSGHQESIQKLVDLGADIWASGRSYDPTAEWSALRLAHFGGMREWSHGPLLKVLTPEPGETTRVNKDDTTEEWGSNVHTSHMGFYRVGVLCWGCLVTIRGMRWKCIECTQDVSFCFKCYAHRLDMHNREHTFEEIGPWFSQPPPPGWRPGIPPPPGWIPGRPVPGWIPGRPPPGWIPGRPPPRWTPGRRPMGMPLSSSGSTQSSSSSSSARTRSTRSSRRSAANGEDSADDEDGSVGDGTEHDSVNGRQSPSLDGETDSNADFGRESVVPDSEAS